MNNRVIRELPFPLTSHFTEEVVRQIQAIPDSEIEYTQEEIEWMERAIQNIDSMMEHAKPSGLGAENMIVRRAQIMSQLEVALQSKKD